MLRIRKKYSLDPTDWAYFTEKSDRRIQSWKKCYYDEIGNYHDKINDVIEFVLYIWNILQCISSFSLRLSRDNNIPAQDNYKQA